MKTSKLTSFTRTTGLAASAVVLAATLAACGGSEETTASGSGSGSSSQAQSTPAAESPTSEESAATSGAAGQTFGPGCSAIPTSGAGSFDGMVMDPVATAASNNPLLSTLVTAVTEAGLVDTLNGAEGLTVFAPTNEAFAKIPAETLKKVLADKATLTKILTHHVVAGQLDPAAVAGMQETLNKDSVNVTGGTDGMQVEGAAVLCGNIPTANATVYVIDTVMMPKGM